MYKEKNFRSLAIIFFTLQYYFINGVSSSDPDLEKYLREVIDNFRDQMKVGLPEINMPIIDPLELQDLDVKVEENLATMDLKIHQLQVHYLSNFNITNLKPDLESLYLELNLTLPQISVNGNYSVNGRLLKILPIYGHGPFDINATQVQIFGKGQLGIHEDTLEMHLLKLDLFWEDLSIFMQDFLGGGNFSEVLQRVVTGVGKDVFQAYKPIILQKLEDAITNKVNEKLQDPFAKDIVKGILELE